ncbi:helix-turn-helix domain-containing protein [Clostridioides difficile]|uniref:helix-turn-helix domain-containing protein n=1 Tax=Clostridioides difficile TaxID=1496 RepID=UPI000825A28E|nr:helix-turn-helix domain-containing protein [Clostridioides difficile]MDB0345045.1 helix-turn-helix domain-containing protein [Clostridioides difficile]MDB0465000.1 helix-turn-helix domain-containing protein [Clostridioides difficile]MDB2859115.1 helix-turn-helix domain-containing protein [Clostridioides difficile]HBG7257383.1 helix-turn-helix domain-containing protein [Clostridioides difficile]
MSLEEVKELEKKYKLPMPTFCLKEKGYFAREYAALMLLSNGGMKIMHTEKNRYLYQNKFDIDALAKQLSISRATLYRNIKKLEELKCDILKIENTKNGTVYRLKYGIETGYNDEVHKFVTIHHKILEELVINFKTPNIKLYCLLCYLTNETDFKVIDEEFLCNNIGLCGKSESNKNKVRSMIRVLIKCKYIDVKKENRTFWNEETKNKINKTLKLYRLCSYEEWKNLNDKTDLTS